MNKNKLLILILATLLLTPLLGIPSLLKFSPFISVGPEGVDAHVHGVEWTPQGVQHGTRADGDLYTVADAVPSQTIGWVGDRITDASQWQECLWKRPDPYATEIELNTYTHHGEVTQIFNVIPAWDELSSSLVCNIRTRQAEVHEVNVKGDPLGTRSPTEIVWYQWEAKTREETIGETTEIEWTRYEAFVVPVDFVVEVSVRALTDGSWGAFEDLHLWYVLDTVRWHNAFAEPYGSLESNGETPEGAELKSYNYRGAFPIWAWIQEWDPFVYEDESGSTLDLPSEVPNEMQDYLQISPSLGGTRLTLYHEPNWQYVDLYAKDIVKDDSKLGNTLESEIAYLPDPRFAETVFTPITLSKFGAYYSSSGWWLWKDEKWVYPTAYIRVRCLYAVWGQWIYLWTEQEAEDQGYEWENTTSIIYHHDSTWNQFWGGVGTGLSNLASNPFFWLWLSLIGGIVFIVLVVIILGPSAIALFGGWLRSKIK